MWKPVRQIVRAGTGVMLLPCESSGQGCGDRGIQAPTDRRRSVLLPGFLVSRSVPASMAAEDTGARGRVGGSGLREPPTADRDVPDSTPPTEALSSARSPRHRPVNI